MSNDQSNSPAEHWNRLYRDVCQLRRDDAARYGQRIEDMESALEKIAAMNPDDTSSMCYVIDVAKRALEESP